MWRLPKFQDLSKYTTISIDTETDGLNPWDGVRCIGVSICYKMNGEYRSFYYPWGHVSGEQYSKREVLHYLRQELKGKTIICFNGKFDQLMLLMDGLDLRNNTFQDGILAAPLIKDDEPSYSLDNLCEKYLGERKLKIDVTRLKYKPSDEVGPYAERDAELHYRLHEHQEEKLTNLDLWDAYNLECRVLPATIEMEYNGLPINQKKLLRYEKGIQVKLKELVLELTAYENQLSFNDLQGKGIDYNSPKWLKKIFTQENIPFVYNFDCPQCQGKHKRYVAPMGGTCPFCESEGEVSSPHFGQQIYKLDHPFINTIKKVKKYDRLLNTFIKPWIGHDIFRYQLNQLRSDQYGTISGRYSANAWFGGANPQQLWKVGNQIEELGDEFIIRELFEDDLLFSCDASQIEYRLFGHYSGSRTIISAYNNDPNTDYHQFIADTVFRGKLHRDKAKHPNFGILYGLGANGLAEKLGCTVEEAQDIYEDYYKQLPEVKRTMDRMKAKAKDKGFVKTLYRRRRYFPDERYYKAINAIIQGSAAEVMKERLAALYEEKLGLLRLTVHDEVVGRTQSEKETKNIKECLESFQGPKDMVPMRIPLLWDMKVGKHWGMK